MILRVLYFYGQIFFFLLGKKECGNVVAMHGMNVTINDIAKRTGVSKSTVSRVLCNSVHVSPATREKVLECAKELDFKPNYFAKGLKTKRSRTIAFLVPNIEIMIYPAIIHAMEVETLKRGYTILLCDIQENKDIAMEYIRNLKSRNVDGFIFSSAFWDEEMNNEIREAREAGFPIVNLLRTDDSNTTSVVLDNAKGSEMGVDFLISKGKHRIAYLQGQENLKLYRDRFDGYVRALDKHRIPFDECLVWYGFEDSENVVSRIVEGKIKSGLDVDAVFCSSDNLAVETIHAITELGLKIPSDISVLGYDNVPISEMLVPRLTAIGQPFKEMGKKAVDVLIDLIEGKEMDEGKNYVFEPFLTIRDTVS